jgi:hypothetical protein
LGVVFKFPVNVFYRLGLKNCDPDLLKIKLRAVRIRNQFGKAPTDFPGCFSVRLIDVN